MFTRTAQVSRRFSIKFGFSIVAVLISATMWPGSAQEAQAQSYPQEPIRLVIGFGQGGPTDVAARVMADKLTAEMGQQVFVENRPGASGNIATQTVAEAPADGYSYLIGALPLAVNHSRFPNFPVKFGRDIVAIAAIGATNNVLVVNPDVEASTVEEFAALAKAKPDELSCGTFGKGSSSHLGMAEFEGRAHVDLLEVPYKSNSDTVNDIIGGHINCWFAPVPSVAALVEAGKLRALAATGPERVGALPDVPTFAELGYDGFDVRLWIGLFGRADVPADRLDTMIQAAAKVLATDEMKAALEKQGLVPMEMDRAQFTDFVNAEIERWSAIGSQLN